MKTGIDFYIDQDVVIKQKDTAIFGNHVAIDKGFYCTTQIDVGDYVHISPYCTVIGGVDAAFKMGHFSGLSAGARVICCGDNFTSGHLMNPQVPLKYRKIDNRPVLMLPFSCVGTNSVIMPGVVLAEGSVVGANSIVTKSTEPWTVYVGNPAKPVRLRDNNRALNYAKELGYEF